VTLPEGLTNSETASNWLEIIDIESGFTIPGSDWELTCTWYSDDSDELLSARSCTKSGNVYRIESPEYNDITEDLEYTVTIYNND